MGIWGIYPHEKRGSGVPPADNHSDNGFIRWGRAPNTSCSPESSVFRYRIVISEYLLVQTSLKCSTYSTVIGCNQKWDIHELTFCMSRLTRNDPVPICFCSIILRSRPWKYEY
eukprot:scaffold3450_cov114-Cylindrotheca_fusiformis.AAC.24